MDKTWLGIIGTVLAVVVITSVIGGCSLSCRESFWNKDKQVIELKHD